MLTSEYIWVTTDGKCWFSDRGFEFRWQWDEGSRRADVFVRATAVHERPWFKLCGDLADEYFGRYYEQEVKGALERYNAE